MLKPIIKLSSIYCAAALLAGCSNIFTQLDSNHTPHNTLDYSNLELQERTGVNHPQISPQQAFKQLAAVKQRALKRYSSEAPRDKIELKFTKASFTNSAIFNLRNTSVVISRGDSRKIKFDDIDLRHSGVSAPLRVTYAENQSIFLNGEKVGIYDPTMPQLSDFNVLTENGTLSARLSY